VRALVVIGLVSLLGGCQRERARPEVSDCPTWTSDVASLLAERCVGCHGGQPPAAGYDLTSYLGALGSGSDPVANAIAGDAASKLLAVLAPEDATHAALLDNRALLSTWVVDCRLAYLDSPLHAGGLMNPVDADFHGALLRREGWNFALCRGCHGDPTLVDDFSGGTSGKPCTGCHDDGPTACGTCHPARPESGAHPAHLVAGALERPTACGECHPVPTRWDDPGHILLTDGQIDDVPAEVVLGPLAARDLVPPRRTGPPAYDPASGRCDNIYCHGGALGDSTAMHPSPVWTATGQGQAGCGGCHGLPPSDHVTTASCTGCHPDLPADRHLDGKLQLGDDSGTCSACHGEGDDPAPPRDLGGNRLASALGVGAHQEHLRAGRLRGPIACGECHVVPAQLTSPGHLDPDPPAEVLPAGTGTLARADGANPVWERASASCSGVYCHGGGAKLAGDSAPGLHREPVWTRVGLDEATCGTCHGVPPVDGVHAPTLSLSDCHGCHAGSVDEFGRPIISGPPGAETSEHIDGNVDL